MERSCVIYKNMCFILFLAVVFSCNTDALSYKYFSTKTPYAWVQNITESDVLRNELYNLTEVKGMCSAVHVSSVLRHGARYASLSQVKKTINIHSKIKAAMKEDVNPVLYNWTNRFPLNDDKNLTPLGMNEHEGIGRRTAKKLESLLSKYPRNVNIFVSSEARTNQSAYAFYKGMVNKTSGGIANFASKVKDDLLRFYSSCEKYIASVEDNKTALMEYEKFLSNKRLIIIKEKIEGKLNITKDTLSTEDIDLIYGMCGYETALYNDSAWCSLLDDADMEVVEYLEDLDSYYVSSYGYSITWKQSCPLVSEIFTTMDGVIDAIKRKDINGFWSAYGEPGSIYILHFGLLMDNLAFYILVFGRNSFKR